MQHEGLTEEADRDILGIVHDERFRDLQRESRQLKNRAKGEYWGTYL